MEYKATTIIDTLTDNANEVEVTVAEITGGYSVAMKDIETGIFITDAVTIYKTYDAAKTAATDLIEKTNAYA